MSREAVFKESICEGPVFRHSGHSPKSGERPLRAQSSRTYHVLWTEAGVTGCVGRRHNFAAKWAYIGVPFHFPRSHTMEAILNNPLSLAAFVCGVAAIYLVVMRTLRKRDD